MKAVFITIAALLALNIWQYWDRNRLRSQQDTTRSQLTLQVRTLTAEKEILSEKLEIEQKAALSPEEILKAPSHDSSRSPMSAMSEAMENPAMREMIAAQQKATLNATYRRLYETLGLEGEELEHFQNLLTDTQMVATENGMKMFQKDISPQERQALAKVIADSQEDLKARVKEFLNDDADFEYYEFYAETLAERMAMNTLRGSLEETSQPLESETEEVLVKLMQEERLAIDFEDHFYDQNRFDPSTITRPKIDRFMEQYDQLQNNLAQRAESLLAGDQLEAFLMNQKTSRAMQEAGLGMMFQMFGQE